MPFSLHDLQLLLRETFLLFATCAVIAVDLIVKPAQRDATHWMSIAVLAATLALVVGYPAAPDRGFSGMFVHDAVSRLLKVFILLVVIAVFVYARTYLKDRKLFVG